MKTQRLQHNYSSQQCCLLYVSHWQKASWLIQQIICVTATVAGHPFWSLGTSADRFLGFCSLLLFSHWPVWWGRWSGTWWCLSPCQTSEEQNRTWVAVWSVYRPGCWSWIDDSYVIRGLLHPQGVFAGVLDKTNLNVVNLLLVVHHQDQRFAVGVDGAVPHQEGPVLSWPVHEDCISHAGVISLTDKEFDLPCWPGARRALSPCGYSSRRTTLPHSASASVKSVSELSQTDTARPYLSSKSTESIKHTWSGVGSGIWPRWFSEAWGRGQVGSVCRNQWVCLQSMLEVQRPTTQLSNTKMTHTTPRPMTVWFISPVFSQVSHYLDRTPLLPREPSVTGIAKHCNIHTINNTTQTVNINHSNQ